MQTQLPKTPQSSGGMARSQKLADWEKGFIAMLGGSKRPITKDRKPSPEWVAQELKQESVDPKRRIPWLAYYAVSMRGGMVSSKLAKPGLVKQIEEMGEIAGLLGVIQFGNQFRTYTRRFLLDPLAQKRLDEAATLYADHFKTLEADELMRRGRDANDARLFAQVYLDPGGQTMSMYYSFHPKELPEPGSKRVGIVYLTDATKAHGHYDAKTRWIVRYHMEDPYSKKHAGILKQATERFNEVVKKLQEIQTTEVPKG